MSLNLCKHPNPDITHVHHNSSWTEVPIERLPTFTNLVFNKASKKFKDSVENDLDICKNIQQTPEEEI